MEQRSLITGRHPPTWVQYRRILVLALLVRTAFCLAVNLNPQWQLGSHSQDSWSSSDGYVLIARSIIEDGRFAFGPDEPSTAHRAPVFPCLIALTYLVTGSFGSAVVALNIVASSVTCLLIFFIARQFFSQVPSYRIAILGSLYPHAIYYCVSGFSDTMITLTATAYAAALVAAVRRRTVTSAVIAGILLGAAVLTKPVLLLFPLVAIGYAWWWDRKLVGRLVIQTVVMLLVIAPWSARVYKLTHGIVPVATGAGFNLLVGNYIVDEEWGSCDIAFRFATRRAMAYANETLQPERPFSIRTKQGAFDVDERLDRELLSLGLYQWARDPLLPFRKILINGLRFWYFCSSAWKSGVSALINFPLVILAGIGVIRCYRSRAGGPCMWLALLVVYNWMMHSLLIVHSRFYLSVMPIVIVGAAAAFVNVTRSSPDDPPRLKEHTGAAC